MASGLTESADLIVEDGTGKDDSNSYSDLAGVTAYVNLRQDVNLLPWLGANESNRVAAAIIATQFLDLRWRYEGSIANPGDDEEVRQRLQWPRSGVYDDRGVEVEDDEIPELLAEAFAEYSARALDPTTFQARQLLTDQTTEDGTGARRRVKETYKKVGPIVNQVKYFGRSSGKFADYGNADEIIKRSGYLSTAGERTVRV
jgi:hypothetical protein